MTHNLWALPQAEFTKLTNNLELSYRNFLDTKNLGLAQQLLHQNFQSGELETVIQFYKKKQSLEIDNMVFNILRGQNKFEVLNKIYFSNSKDKATYLSSRSAIFRDTYYQSFVFNYDFTNLTREILANLHRPENLFTEIRFFRLMSKMKPPIQKIISMIDSYQPPAVTLNDKSHSNTIIKPSLEFTREILKSFFYYYLKDYAATYHMIEKLNQMTSTEVQLYPALLQQYQIFIPQFANELYSEGYYTAFLKLTTSGDSAFLSKSIAKEKIKRASLLAHQPLDQLNIPPSPNYFHTLKQRSLFFQKKYNELIVQHLNYKSSFKDEDLQATKYYLFALAATKQWDIYQKVVSQLFQKEYSEKIFYLWLAKLTTPKLALETALEIDPAFLNSWQIDFLNLVDETGEVIEVAQIIKSLILQQPIKLVALKPKEPKEPKEPKNKVKQKKLDGKKLLYEYTISKLAENAYKYSDFKKVEDLFNQYYSLLTFKNFKEKFLLYHGLAILTKDPQEGKKILYKLLYLNPQTTYRFEIEEALDLIF